MPYMGPRGTDDGPWQGRFLLASLYIYFKDLLLDQHPRVYVYTGTLRLPLVTSPTKGAIHPTYTDCVV